MAKQLNNLITPFIPAKYTLNSTDDFVHIHQVLRTSGLVASLDAESLFTNVPVLTTIDIICDCINNNNNPQLPPPNIDRNQISQLLLACTTKFHFGHINGNRYQQKDGDLYLSIWCLFANFMCHLENPILDTNPDFKPITYCRYIDGFFIITDTIDILVKLKKLSKNSFVLTFTHELGLNNHINLLDVHVDATSPNLLCSEHQTPTNSGIYLNYHIEWPQRYKNVTISAVIHRTYKSSSNWHLFHNQISILKQAFLNNSYPNHLYDSTLKHYLSNFTILPPGCCLPPWTLYII